MWVRQEEEGGGEQRNLEEHMKLPLKQQRKRLFVFDTNSALGWCLVYAVFTPTLVLESVI